jgi:nitrite reductase/ring-hydroxylating ferredoxin subunit
LRTLSSTARSEAKKATAKDSEILTRVGPSTPMGELMRQYWIPAAMSRELRSNDAPMRLMLLGERLIAFRDGSGKIGVMDHRCPHRFASLFYGRNEYDGIRCVYHGFEYDVDGNCLDMPNVPPQYDYKNKIKAKAYKTLERNGLIWVYMGPRTEPPGLPASNPLCFPKIRSSCSSANAIAIGYRPWRATSTPRIWAFSTYRREYSRSPRAAHSGPPMTVATNGAAKEETRNCPDSWSSRLALS